MSTIELTESLGWHAGRSYGCTEHPTSTASSDSEQFDKRAFTDGHPVLGAAVRVVDEAGADVPPGVDGDIWTIGAKQTIGYVDPAIDAEQFTSDGWYKSGDVGRLDADGFLTITDRKKDVIIRLGENISSREVEELLLGLSQILEVAVVAVPDDRTGERVCAVVRLAPHTAVTLEDIDQHFQRCGVARQKTPERLEIVTDYPRTETGKIVKARLREALRAEQA